MPVEKVEKPAEHFEKPKDVAKDQDLTPREKVDALDTWEQDARQLLTASNEGMPGAEEGLELKTTIALMTSSKRNKKLAKLRIQNLLIDHLSRHA